MRLGVGVAVEWHELTEATLARALQEMLGTTKYQVAPSLAQTKPDAPQEKVEEVQGRVLDLPLPPLDSAVWWLEFLLRHPRDILRRSLESSNTISFKNICKINT